MNQIGISNHKNTYSAKTLISNFDEERRAYENLKQTPKVKFDATTTSRDTFRAYNPNEIEHQKVIIKPSLDSHTMFSHQNGSSSPYVTTNDLTFTNSDSSFHFTKTENIFGGSREEPVTEPRRRLLEQKQRQWDQERNEIYYRK